MGTNVGGKISANIDAITGSGANTSSDANTGRSANTDSGANKGCGINTSGSANINGDCGTNGASTSDASASGPVSSGVAVKIKDGGSDQSRKSANEAKPGKTSPAKSPKLDEERKHDQEESSKDSERRSGRVQA